MQIPLRGPVRESLLHYGRRLFFVKDFKTIDEQLALLRSRRLIIPNEEKARLYLLTNNYYNIVNGYSKYFPRDGESYTAGTTFDEVWHLYIFDKEIKKAFLEAILNAESHLKAVLAYRFAERFRSPYAYLNPQCYDQNKISSALRVISTLSQFIKKYSEIKGTSIYHYVHHHHDVPIWVLVNYMDFGSLRYMLSNVRPDLQNAVAKDMMNFVRLWIPDAQKFPPEVLLSFMGNINAVRNVCAHNNRLLGFSCYQNCRRWDPLHDSHPVKNLRSVYSVFITLQCFLTKTEYGALHNTVRKRMNRLGHCLHSITLNDILRTIGFPDNWNADTAKIQY